eukprot:5703393-Prymnesium_polylepis.1
MLFGVDMAFTNGSIVWLELGEKGGIKRSILDRKRTKVCAAARPACTRAARASRPRLSRLARADRARAASPPSLASALAH